MPFVLRQASDTDNPNLAVPYGRQITAGLTAYYAKQGTQTAFISILGQGELDGIDRVYYAGDLLPEFDSLGNRIWQFHPGTFSTGFDDPIQGRPTFFPDLDFTFSGIAYIEVKLPSERSSDDEPDKMKFFVRGRKVQNYVMVGDVLTPSGDRVFSANNALIAADIITSFMGLPLTRIDGPSLLEFRDKCDELISWEGGNETTTVSGFQNVLGASVDSVNGGIHRTASGPSWGVSGAETKSYVDATVDSYFEVVAGEGTFIAGYGSGVSGYDDTDIVFGVQCNLANNFSYVVDGVQHEVGGWAPGNVFRVSIETGVFKLYQNGVEIDTTPPSVPGGTLRGIVVIQDTGSGVDSSKFFPSSTSVVSGEENQVPRYESHVVFTQNTDASAALEMVMFRAPGCHWQDVDRAIKFITVPSYTDITDGTTLPVGGRALSFDLTYDPTQDTKPANIGEGGFVANRKSPGDKPNWLRASFRDLGQQYYDIAYSFVDRKELRAQAGHLIDPGLTPLGVMTQSLSDRIMETQMSLLSDLDLYVTIKGMAGSEVIAKGDIVRLSHDVPEWRDSLPPLFIVMEETFEPTIGSGATADDRTFKLQVYNPGFYSDTHHNAVTGINITPTVSPFSPPPIVDNVELSQRGILQPDDSIALSVDGLVDFDTYPYDQFGRLWVRRIEEERTFASSASTNMLTLVNHNFDDGAPVTLRGTLTGGLDADTLYFVVLDVDTSINTFKLALTQGGSPIDITVDGSGEVGVFRRTQDLIHPVDGSGVFTVENVQIGVMQVIVVTENFFGIRKPFHVHTFWTIDVEAPAIPAPSPFIGVFDDATGDLLLDWAGVSLQNETYELEVRDDGNTTNLRPPIIIKPALNVNLEEFVVWDADSVIGSGDIDLQPHGAFTMGGSSDSMVSKSSAEVLGGFLVHYQLPRTDWEPTPPGVGTWIPMTYVGIMPEGTDPASMPLFFQIVSDAGIPTWVYPEGFSGGEHEEFKRKVIPGDILSIYIRPDGYAEYHANYSPSSKPLYISGQSIDTTVEWKAVVYGVGAIQQTYWLRQGPEWKYLQQAQRIDNSLSSSDPLPNTITVRVRQLAYSGASDWTTEVFTR